MTPFLFKKKSVFLTYRSVLVLAGQHLCVCVCACVRTIYIYVCVYICMYV
jgi:hypothetical protein